MKLSFSSTPELTYDPLCVLRSRRVNLEMREYIFGCMFLATGSVEASGTIEGNPLRAELNVELPGLDG
jgi:hypothetical protein